MKRIYFALVAIALMIASGCQGFLDENPKSQFVGAEAFSTPKLVYINTVASLYTPRAMPNVAEFDQLIYYFDNVASDLVMVPGRRNGWVDGGPHQQMFQHDIDQTFSKLAGTWNAIYTYIALCNRSLDQVVEALEAGGDTKVLNPYLSEIKLLRAYYYAIALDYWGRIPIVTSGKMSISDVAQSKRSEAYLWLLEEVSSIIPDLVSAKSQKTGTYYGRMTKAIGYMLFQELAINAPIYSLDDWANSPYIATATDNYPNAHGFTNPKKEDDAVIYPEDLIKTGRYVYEVDGVFDRVTAAGKSYMIKCPDGQSRNAWETVVWCEQQIKAEGYSLQPIFKDNFVVNNENSVENVFTMPSDETIRRGSTSIFFSQNFDHAKALGIAIACNGPVATIQSSRLWGYDPETMTCADPRMGYTVSYGVQYKRDGVTPIPSTKGTNPNQYLCYYPEMSRLDYPTTYDGSYWTYFSDYGGPRANKVGWDFNASNPFSVNNTDRVVYRYADAVLNAAEANKRLGNEGLALGQFNQIRNRAHVEPYTTISAQDLIDERAREFAWEPGRRSDLVRFGMFTLPTDDKFVGVPAHMLGGKYKEDLTGVTTVYPIPISVLQLNKNLSQNPWK